ncbi:MAG: PAS domain S-box protein [Bacteroidales bacterium]|nr:PAS domain S-box protein [Bacteroidales bacterium]
MNQAFCDILGYSNNELLGKKWTEITHPEDIEESQEIINKLVSGIENRPDTKKIYS